MFMFDPAIHRDAPAQQREKAQNPQKPSAMPFASHHAGDIVAEMEAARALPVALDGIVTHSSRLLGVGLFVLSLGGTGWMVTSLF